MASYRYPDDDDAITAAMITAISDPVSWQADERQVLTRLEEWIQAVPPPRRLLDVGAGLGRLAMQFVQFFARGELIEPDDARRALLEQWAPAMGLAADRFRIAPALPQAPADQVFDVALLSHVLQHVPVDDVVPILQGVGKLLRPGGILYLATALSVGAADGFGLALVDTNGAWSETPVGRARFDELARVSEAGALPVHFFARLSLEQLVSRNGFEVLETLPFHIVAGDSRGDAPRPRDVALIARRGRQPG